MYSQPTAVPAVLSPDAYRSLSHFEAERKAIFRRTWQCVAALDELTEEGSYVAHEVAGVPIVVRRTKGELRAFVNVCPHRHSLIVSPGLGCSEKLSCRYHGWEFNGAGKLSHLPDARSFKGFRARDACLETVAVRVFARMVFVRIEGESEPADDFGDITPLLEKHLGGLTLMWKSVTELDVNWKILVDNAVESYHVPIVHQATFGANAPEELERHTVAPSYTRFDWLAAEPVTRRDRWKAEAWRRAWSVVNGLIAPGGKNWGYSHFHLFPANLLAFAGLGREWTVIEPLAPTRTRRVTYVFGPSGMRRPLRPYWTRRSQARTMAIFEEDQGIFEAVQRGLAASPFTGVLSRREERIRAYHEWLVAALAAPSSFRLDT